MFLPQIAHMYCCWVFRRCEGGSKQGATWSVCILLLTEKSTTAPLYKSLAAQFGGMAAFGVVGDSNKAIAAQLKVDK